MRITIEHLVFATAFIWALCVGVLLQLWIFPTFFSHHYWGAGLVQGDWVLFHKAASEIALGLRNGSSSIPGFIPELAPAYPLGFIYFLTGFEAPIVFLPLAAIVHGASACAIFFIMLELGCSKRAAVCSTLPYVFFPSAVTMYSQVHRDGFVFLAFFLVVFSLIKLVRRDLILNLKICLIFLLGIVLMAFFRPYLLNVFAVFFVFFAFYLLVKFRSKKYMVSSVFILLAGLLLYFGQNVGQVSSLRSEFEEHTPGVSIEKSLEKCAAMNLIDRMTPQFVNRQLCKIQWVRDRAVLNFPAHIFNDYHRMHTFQDLDISTVTKFTAALPQIFWIAFVEPIPHILSLPYWTLFNKIALVESIGFVIILIFLIPYLVLARLKKKEEMILSLALATFFLVVSAAATVNLNTLYRIRFGYVMLIAAIGLGVLYDRPRVGKSE